MKFPLRNCHAEYNPMVRNCGKFFSSFYSYLFLRQFPLVGYGHWWKLSSKQICTRIMRSKISGNFVPSRCITNDYFIHHRFRPIVRLYFLDFLLSFFKCFFLIFTGNVPLKKKDRDLRNIKMGDIIIC
jgi:hypothetical protein